MTRRILAGGTIGLAVLGIGLVLLIRDGRRRGEMPVPDGRSRAVLERNLITIRNVTRTRVAYTIKPAGFSGPAEKKNLNPGGLDRYPGKKRLFLAYERLGNEIKETLIPGTPYSFRYDENNLIHLYLGSHMREEVEDLAPYVETPLEVATKMLEMAGVGETDFVYDLGCGDGRMVILAARMGARGVGVDIVPRRIEEARAAARRAGVESLVEFRVEDAMKTNFSRATVLALYLLPESNALLSPKFESDLKPGARVVTHDYPIPGWEARRIDSTSVKDKTGKSHTIFLYRR